MSNITNNRERYLTPSDFDPIFSDTEDNLIYEVVKQEMAENGFKEETWMIPEEALKKRNILFGVFSLCTFIYITLLFFHFVKIVYMIGAVILAILGYKSLRKFKFRPYIIQQVKAHPHDAISGIVRRSYCTMVTDNTKLIRTGVLIAAIVLPLLIFSKPRIIYNKTDIGTEVSYYIIGITSLSRAEVPASHNGEPVTVIRGDSFANMPFLKTVKLPESVIKINGKAFKNDVMLEDINIPGRLEYLGGGAFYNCESLGYVKLPDTLTYMGGETFYGSGLVGIRLSANLTEIRGDSFRMCTSLKSIEIPDNVVRIGGHAFYGDSSLREVIFTRESKLKEIGSSAFRECSVLKEVILPAKVSINERAFKESPTNVMYFR